MDYTTARQPDNAESARTRSIIAIAHQQQESQGVDAQAATESGLPSCQQPRSKPSDRSAPRSADGWPSIAAGDLPVDILLPRLRDVTQLSHCQWAASCPAHPDSKPSLSVTEIDNYSLLIYCHAGCQSKQVLNAVGLRFKDLYPTRRATFIATETGRRKVHPPSASSGPQVPRDEQIPEISEYLAAHFAMYARSGRVGAIGSLEYLGQLLHLPAAVLKLIGVGNRFPPGHWTFPEYDGRSRICGIILRENDGAKKALPGSCRGLTLPLTLLHADAPLPVGPLYLAEGATDTAALLSVGCLAIGRPAAHPSRAVCSFLAELFARNPSVHVGREILVVGDNDPRGPASRAPRQPS